LSYGRVFAAFRAALSES